MTMRNLARYRGYVIMALLNVIALGALFLYDRRPQPEPLAILTPSARTTPAIIQVHVAGAVHQPGLYSLPAGSRLHEAIQAAGGLHEDADAERVNLADYVQDAQQLYIPRQGLTPPPGPTAASGAASVVGTTAVGQRLVNINSASPEELMTLPGIGAVYAERIVAYRQQHGPFGDPQQLMQVNGIGSATYERLKAYITVR
jgi:competence protein ComEA